MNSVVVIITEICTKDQKSARPALQERSITATLVVVVHLSTVFFFFVIRRELFARLTRRQVQVWLLQEQGNTVTLPQRMTTLTGKFGSGVELRK